MTDNSRLFNVAIVGATGAVGETLLEVLEERNFPVDNLLSKLVKKQNPRSSNLRIKTIRTFGMPLSSTVATDIALGSLSSDVTAEFNHSLNKLNGFSVSWSLFLNPVVASFMNSHP